MLTRRIAHAVKSGLRAAKKGREPQTGQKQGERTQIRQHPAHGDASGVGCSLVIMARKRPRLETSITRT